VALLLLVPAAAADTFNVPGDFETIQAAVNGAADGDTITVKKGNYPETVSIENRSNLVLIGKGKPLINAIGDVSGLIVIDSDGIELRGFTVQNHSEAGIHVRGSTGVVVSKCVVTGGQIGVHVDNGTNVLVEKNTIETPIAHGIRLFATLAGGGQSCHVLKNRIVGSAGRGISVRGEDNLIEGNLMEGIVVTGIEVLDDASLTMLLKNKVRDGFGRGIEVFSALGTHIERNDVRDLDDVGLFVNAGAQGLRTVKNKFTRIASNAISIDNTGSECDGDRIVSPELDGLDIDGGSGTYTDVKVVKAGDDGWDVDAGGNEFAGCSSTKAAGCGFLVDSDMNVFTKCKASGSVEADLLDAAGEGANTYEDCKFKKVAS
jgi:hypothetical protein